MTSDKTKPKVLIVATTILAVVILSIGYAGVRLIRTFGPVTIAIDAQASRHPISPLIYGVNGGDAATLADLNAPLNRLGGDDTSLYNWQQNARNTGKDWFFESLPADGGAAPGARADDFIDATKRAGAQPMVTIPMIGWVAALGPDGAKRASFSVAKYGLQQLVDTQWDGDAGNGIRLDGSYVSGNDPNDAAVPSTADTQRAFVDHLVEKWGKSGSGGPGYYILDNEPSLWFRTHRDVRPIGARAEEIAAKTIEYARMIKAADPDAKVIAPEEWGWSGYLYSGYDQQYAVSHGYGATPDRTQVMQGQDYLPWLLTRWKAAGHPVDVVSVHYYPEGGVYSDDDSPAMQLHRNRSTRSLWDSSYVDESWINTSINLIPRLRQWVDTYYDPHTPIAITEYNWGAEKTMNGATAQADVLGIFGREGLDIATRWTVPDPTTPTYKAIKMYRNYDGHKASFGDIGVAATVPNPDLLSAFASVRSSDGTLTAIIVNKGAGNPKPIRLDIAHFSAAGNAQVYQLDESNKIQRLADLPVSDASLTTTVPPQSVTLFVLPGH